MDLISNRCFQLCNISFPTFVQQIFGGNMDGDTERRHYLNHPFSARYVRLHPLTWRHGIGLRAALLGCPHKAGSDCGPGFFHVNAVSGCSMQLHILIYILFCFVFLSSSLPASSVFFLCWLYKQPPQEPFFSLIDDGGEYFSYSLFFFVLAIT